jgi:TonB family protein
MSGLSLAPATIALAALTSIQAAAPKPDVVTVGAVVLLANKTGAEATDAVRRSLASPDPLVRRAAARLTAVAHPDAFDALRRALATERDPIVIIEFVRDVIALAGAQALPIVDGPARLIGSDAFVPIAEWFARMNPTAFAARLRGWAEVPHLDRDLPRLVRLAIACHPEAREEILSIWRDVASPDKATAGATTGSTNTGTVTQTPEELATRLLSATLSAAGCRMTDRVIGAIVLFSPDGRPRSIDLQRQEITTECRAALEATARMTTADVDDPARAPHEVVIPLSKEFLTCSITAADQVVVTTVDHVIGVRDPRLTREVKPQYTSAAMKAKLQGVVELEAVISASGCVSHLRSTRSLSGLDLQALAAVLQWRFDPARLEERAVPAIVMIEMTFSLK